MSFVLYVVVLVVSVTSVMMGLDWLSTPPPPIPKSVQTVSAPAKPAAPAADKKTADNKTADKKIAATKPAPQPSAATTGAASAPVVANTDKTDAAASTMAPQPDAAAPAAATAGSAPVNASNDALANADGTTTAMGRVGDVNGAVADAADAAVPRCDIQACTARYRSFSPADCTYQPFDGPRRLCTVGNPPSQASTAPAGVQTSDASQPSASSSCNYDACAEAYRSFDPATCTWQPFEGPRRLCEK